MLILQNLPTQEYWYWIGIVVLLGYTILFNVILNLAFAHLNRKSSYVSFFVDMILD